MLYLGEKVYNDSNFHECIGDGQTVVAGGERRLLSRTPRPHGFDDSGFCRANFEDVFPVFPESEWMDRLNEQIKNKARISDCIDFAPPDQDGLPTCWAIGSCHAVAMKRRIQGLPFKPMSGCSIAVPISGGHSGGYEGDALEMLVKDGCCSTDVWAENNTSRSLISDPKVVEDRKNHKVKEFYRMNSREAWATACLMKLPGLFAYNWMSHVMAMCDLVRSGSVWAFRPRNTWGPWGARNDHGQPGFAVYEWPRGIPDSGYVLGQVESSPI